MEYDNNDWFRLPSHSWSRREQSARNIPRPVLFSYQATLNAPPKRFTRPSIRAVFPPVG
jgi:hypothetical protein